MSYKENVARVSDIVSFTFPFEGNSKDRYISWLDLNNIDPDLYMAEAQEVGTFIHKQMENFINKEVQEESDALYSLHRAEITGWLEWLQKQWFISLESEKYVCDENNRYQWTIDLVATKPNGKKVLIDWKSWGVRKKRFWLKNEYKKPYDKLKKVALQLSLYAKALEDDVDEIWIVWLHESGAYMFPLEMWKDEEIEKIIENFLLKDVKKEDIDIYNIKINNMIITMQRNINWEQYSVNQVVIDMYKETNGKTVKELVDDWMKVMKYIDDNFANKWKKQ